MIGIIGMGGVGKTTLARLIFDEAEKKFDLRAWVSVGEDFDTIRLTKIILQSVGGDSAPNDLNLLQENLKAKLSEKKFFMVLDDVWNEHYEAWTTFCSPFESRATGSRMIITTRNLSVSLMMGARDYPLQELKDDDCLSVFAHHAFGVTNFEEHLHLEAIGKKIVERCQGLPLAAKAIGGLLRGKTTRDAWEQVLNSGIWEDKSGILPALRLSYHHLPSHLKQCFAYCAIFPKDYKFNEDELVLQWMAEGFLQNSREMKQMKCSGHRYFQDLLWRSFFQQSTGNKSGYVMHDLVNDLAKSVSGEICLHFDNDELKGIKSHANVRHSAFTPHEYDRYQRFEAFYEMNNLRTFLTLYTHQWRRHFLSIRVVHDLVPKLKRLRVLSLAGYRFAELPSSIGALKHLRYLDLSYNTWIKRLPKSLSNLHNLQTLKLNGCTNLIELPADIGALTNLMHLDLKNTFSLRGMPLGVADLTNLQTLSKFIVGKGSNCLGIRELMNFPHLEGQLRIQELHNVVRTEYVDLKKIENLGDLALAWTDKLTLEWTDKSSNSPREEDHQIE